MGLGTDFNLCKEAGDQKEVNVVWFSFVSQFQGVYSCTKLLATCIGRQKLSTQIASMPKIALLLHL